MTDLVIFGALIIVLAGGGGAIGMIVAKRIDRHMQAGADNAGDGAVIAPDAGAVAVEEDPDA